MKITYTTSDGKTFEDDAAAAKAHERELKAAAKKHERELKAKAKRKAATERLVNLLTARVPDLTPEQIDAIVAAIQDDPSAVKPLLRKQRSDAGVKRGPPGPLSGKTQAKAAA